MAVNAPISLPAHVRRMLGEYVSKMPIYSTIEIALETINRLSEKKKGEEANLSDKNVPKFDFLGVSWSEHWVVASALRSIVTYLALYALSWVSLYINGVIGLAKTVYAFSFVKRDYAQAQAKLEEGVYQLLTAVYDYAIGQFGLLCAPFAIIHGFFPETALKIHQKIFQPFVSAIEHEPIENKKKNTSLLQCLADAIQEIIFPTNGVHFDPTVMMACVNGNSPRKPISRSQTVPVDLPSMAKLNSVV